MLNNNRSILIIVILIVLIGCYFLINRKITSGYDVKIVTASVDRGNIVSSVTANGTLKPNLELEIYSEIEGTIENVFFDINDSVVKGDVLAVIEPAQFEIRFKEAQAKYNKASAELKLDKDIFYSDGILYQKNLISKQEFENSKARYKSALAIFREASTNMESAKQELNKTNIRTLIDGVILARNVNVGQLVTDSGNSKFLFTIADDLKKMNLIIHVSEADIGKTAINQPVKFRVSAYPDELFNGKIIKISNSPNNDKDVVTYDVKAEIDNPELKLKPGMTAEVKIIVADKNNVLKIPTSALRFVPNNIDNSKNQLDGKLSVWVKESNGKFTKTPVEIGVSNNEFTEVLKNSLREGQEIVIDSYSDNKGPKSVLTLPQPKRF